MSNNGIYSETIGQGADLVLLHGWGFHSGIWQSVLPTFTKYFRVTLIDLPGFGKSAAYTGAYDLASVVENILNVAPLNAHFLGWSLGGLLAYQLALQAPERVNKLITVASSPCFIAEAKWPGINTDVLKGFHQDLTRDYKATLTRFLSLQFLGCESANDLLRTLKKQLFMFGEPALQALHAGLTLLENIDLRAQLIQLNQAVLHIFGGLDALVPRRIITPLTELMPQSQIVLIDKASHVPFLTHASEFENHVLDFLNAR